MNTKPTYFTRRCGYTAIIGRPNVGKSTLLNSILATKLSITSSKPQTTRHAIVGIKTQGLQQTIYIDTPGLHRAGRQVLLNRYMNRSAISALEGADVIGFVIAGLAWGCEDEAILDRLSHLDRPIVLIINKADRVKPKTRFLSHLEGLAYKMNFAAMVPVSAKTGTNITELERVTGSLLPVGEFIFPEETLTEQCPRFRVGELIREKLMRHLHQEIPYGLTVEIETFEQFGGINRISALIWLERSSQKAIVIGHEGSKLQQIGQQARLEMERLFGCKVFLSLWVKVKAGWANDEPFLRRLYDDKVVLEGCTVPKSVCTSQDLI